MKKLQSRVALAVPTRITSGMMLVVDLDQHVESVLREPGDDDGNGAARI